MEIYQRYHGGTHCMVAQVVRVTEEFADVGMLYSGPYHSLSFTALEKYSK
jgi:hypothetical protein